VEPITTATAASDEARSFEFHQQQVATLGVT
jgi:hypothetical protein